MDGNENNTNSSNSKLALASFICGLISIFIFPLAFGGAAIIFGIMVKDRVERDSRDYQNARLGIIFGIIGIVFWVITLMTMNYLSFDLNSLMGNGQPQSAI